MQQSAFPGQSLRRTPETRSTQRIGQASPAHRHVIDQLKSEGQPPATPEGISQGMRSGRTDLRHPRILCIEEGQQIAAPLCQIHHRTPADAHHKRTGPAYRAQLGRMYRPRQHTAIGVGGIDSRQRDGARWRDRNHGFGDPAQPVHGFAFGELRATQPFHKPATQHPSCIFHAAIYLLQGWESAEHVLNDGCPPVTTA